MECSSINFNKQACSAKTGEGLMAGMEWLSEKIINKKNTRFPNNPYQSCKIIK